MTDKVSEPFEDKLLRMMADQQEELSEFRLEVYERLKLLEKRPRRSVSSLLDFDFEKVFGLAVIFLFALLVTRLVIYQLARTKKGAPHGDSPLPEA
jgi:hypothetical protein